MKIVGDLKFYSKLSFGKSYFFAIVNSKKMLAKTQSLIKIFSSRVSGMVLLGMGSWIPMIPGGLLRFRKTSEKKKSNRTRISEYFVYSYIREIFLNIICQSTQRRISCNTFFYDAYLWSSIWSSMVEVPFIVIDLCSFSKVDVPENVPKPGRDPLYRSPLLCRFEYLQRNYVGQMLWKCAPCSVHCKPD